MVTYPLRSPTLSVATVSVVVLFGLAGAIAVYGGLDDGASAIVAFGVALWACGCWIVWALRRTALVLDGPQLGRRSGLLGRTGRWIDLHDVRLVTDAPTASSLRFRRRDALLWIPSSVESRVSEAMWRRLLPDDTAATLATLEADVGALHPVVVQLNSLSAGAAEELDRAVSSMLPEVPDLRTLSTRP